LPHYSEFGPIIWGLIKLFLRDKEKEERLKYFQEQVDELRPQTSEYQYQSTLMLQANELLEKQINFRAEIHLQTKQENEKRSEIEKLKRLNEIKPHFIYQQGSSSPERFGVTLHNKGGTAVDSKVESVDTDFVFINPLLDNSRIDKGQTINVSGYANSAKTYYNSNQVACRVTIEYRDIDKNTYRQDIRKVDGAGFQIDPPVLIE
jgi:hypothetical protein